MIDDIDKDGNDVWGLAMIDTHIFKLNEYFVELNPANFKVLNRILN